MKISKTALLTLSWVFSIAGLWLMLVSAKELNLIIKPENAVQHIKTVKFIGSWNELTAATLSQVGNSLAWIDTSSFVLSSDGSNEVGPKDVDGSSILGWVWNKIWNTSPSKKSVILGWDGNSINDSYGTILWWEGNTIWWWAYSTILWWKINTVEGWSSVIAWWTNNHVRWGKSVVVWSNATVEKDLSVALWVNSHINADKSFLWTDGGSWTNTLVANSVFAVVWKSGMVVGTNKAHNFAQLTLNGWLVIRQWGSSLECTESIWWSLKVVTAPGGDGRICLCSCDGTLWTSMFGLGQCWLACDNKYDSPKCGTDVARNCSGFKNVYSWSCASWGWEVLEWNWAYLVTEDNKVHWSCQTDNGLVASCSGFVNINNDCGTHGVPLNCKWDKPSWTGYKFWESTYIYGHNPSKWTRVDDTQEPTACEWRCDTANGYVWNSTSNKCELSSYDCGWTKPTWSGYKFWATKYTYGYTPNSWTYTSNATLNACQYTCDTNYTWNSTTSKCVLNACQWTLPDNATLWNSTVPSNNTTNYSYSATTTTAACKFKCDTNYTWNSTTSKCVQNVCQWTLPDNAVLWNSSAVPSNNTTNYSYSATSTTVACKFKCNTNYTWNSTTSKCVLNQNTLTVDPNGGKVTFDWAVRSVSHSVTKTPGSTIEVPNATRAKDTSGNGTYRVTYDANGWSSVVPSYKDVQRYETKSYDFNKWNDAGTACGIMSPTNIYTFPASNGTTCTKTADWKTTTTYKTDKITLASAPEKAWSTFAWWKSSIDGNIYAAGDEYTPTADVTMTAQWTTCSHKITYNPDGWKWSDWTTTNKEVNVSCGSSTTLMAAPTKAWYEFYRWKTQIGGIVARYLAGSEYTPTVDVTMIAEWTEKDPQTKNCDWSIPTWAEKKTGHWTYTQTWNGTSWQPTQKSWSYNADVCGYLCKTNYTWNGSVCVLNACQWTLPDNATLWNSSAVPSNNTTNYSYSATSTTAACKFKCNTNYTWNSTTSKCDSISYACQWTLPNNAVLWNSSATPSNNTTNYSYSATTTTAACKFKCDTNYTWNSTTSKCVQNACQWTLPNNATLNNSSAVPSNNTTNYFHNATSTAACAFKCIGEGVQYTWNSTTSKCDPISYVCQWTLPDNAILWNSSAAPSNNTTYYSYSATTTTAACKFKCPVNYTYNSTTNKCVPNTQEKDCTWLPSNAEWVNGKFIQTWNGSAWTPTSKTATYSTDSSVECSFKCKTHYTWNSTSKTCVADTQTVNCGWSIPSNAEKKSGHWTYTQTWNGTSWQPTKSWSYDVDVCGYLCKTDYTWNSTVSMCVKCQWTLPDNAVLWNSSAIPSNNTTNYEYSSSSTTAACKFKCINTNYTWNSSTNKCEPVQKLTVRFYANWNKIPVGQNAYEENYIELQCTVGNDGTCEMQSPAITASSNTPTVIWWSTAADRHHQDWAAGAKIEISSNATYYAQTKKDYELKATFHANGNNIQRINTTYYTTNDQTITCVKGTLYNWSTNTSSLNSSCSVQSPGIQEPTDGTVLWWSNAANSRSIQISQNGSANITADSDFYAQTKREKTYTLTLSKWDWVDEIWATSKSCSVVGYNGATPSGSCSVTLPSCTPKTCYESCKFWSYSPGGSYIMSSDSSLTAAATIKKFTLTYNPNWWKWSDWTTSNKIFYNVSCGNITLESAPTKDYYSFLWWYKPGGTVVWGGWGSYSLTESITLSAGWQEDSYKCKATHYLCEWWVTATNPSDSNTTKWTWKCGNVDCYECKNGYNDQGEWVCSESDEDWVCNFDNGKCSAWTYEYINDIGNSTSDIQGKQWRCKWKGNGQSHICMLRWNCKGSCSADSSASTDCAWMYAGTNAPKTRTDCYNAGMYVAYYRNGSYWVSTTQVYTKDTCYLNNPVAWYEADKSCSEESMNYNNNPTAIFGYSRSCMKWTADLKCEQLVDWWTPTTVSTTKCDNVLGNNPVCTSTSSWWWPNGNTGWGSSCKAKSNASYPNWCAAIYAGWTPYNGSSWIAGSSNTAWWDTYCKTLKSVTTCQGAWVASQCVSNCNSSSWLPVYVYNVPWSNLPSNASVTSCCDWN